MRHLYRDHLLRPATPINNKFSFEKKKSVEMNEERKKCFRCGHCWHIYHVNYRLHIIGLRAWYTLGRKKKTSEMTFHFRAVSQVSNFGWKKNDALETRSICSDRASATIITMILLSTLVSDAYKWRSLARKCVAWKSWRHNEVSMDALNRQSNAVCSATKSSHKHIRSLGSANIIVHAVDVE